MMVLMVQEEGETVVTRILVVDDETALVELVRSYLEREQYEVLTAADGRTALELARSAQPDLVRRQPQHTKIQTFLMTPLRCCTGMIS